MTVGTYNITPTEAAESLRDWITGGSVFSASIAGTYGSGKTTALAATIHAVLDLGIDLNEIAVFAPTEPMIRRLRALVGSRWPDADPQADIFAHELSGVPEDAMRRHTALACDDRPVRLSDLKRGYLDILARINDITAPVSDLDRKFLKSLEPRLSAALQADREARLDNLQWPRGSYLAAVRDYVVTYKALHRLRDKPDLVHADYYTSRQVRLLVLDEVDEAESAILTCYFPNASIITASLTGRPADIALHLPICLRHPDRLDIEDAVIAPRLVPPPPDDFASLFLIVPPWRHGPWLAWLSSLGIPPPADFRRWRAVVAAWRCDHGGVTVAPTINPLLTANGLARCDDWLVSADDVEGWTDWRDLAGRFDVRMRDHADAVLARYGQLDELPTVRMARPAMLRGIEADVVITDAAAWVGDDAREIALSRATRQLIVINEALCHSNRQARCRARPSHRR